MGKWASVWSTYERERMKNTIRVEGNMEVWGKGCKGVKGIGDIALYWGAGGGQVCGQRMNANE